MLNSANRARRTGLVVSITAALVYLACGGLPAQARSNGSLLQLAQARGAAPGGGPEAAAPQAGAPQGGSDIERQIAELKRQLKITPQQEPQFNTFADVIRNNAREVDQVMRQAPAGQPNAVEELKREQQFTETEASGLKRLVPALQTLYDSLSDPQKKAADEVLGGGGSGGPGGPGGAPGGPPARGGRD